MPSNTTNYPGMNPQGQQGMYQRTGGAPAGGTVVPGMQKQAPGVEAPVEVQRQAPVVGFLYSISRNGVGEYWPVCVGTNTIGRDPECDICLEEGTVSSHHALLNVKKLKTKDCIVAQIRDEGSKNGLLVNNEELDFGIHECHNNDVIRIGNNYQLLLLLINPSDHGLKVAEEFEALDDMPTPPMGNPFGTSPYDPESRPVNGTQAMDGGNDFSSGGTRFL